MTLEQFAQFRVDELSDINDNSKEFYEQLEKLRDKDWRLFCDIESAAQGCVMNATYKNYIQGFKDALNMSESGITL